MADWDHHAHRTPKAGYDAAVVRAKAQSRRAETADPRPTTPGRPDGGEGGVAGDPLDALRHALGLIPPGEAEEAARFIREFLKTSSHPPEGDEVAAGKSMSLEPRMKARLQEAFRDLQSGPAALEAARVRIREDKQLLAAMDRGLREAESPDRRLLRSIDRAVKGEP